MTLLGDLLPREPRIVSVPPTATVLDAAKAMGEANCGSTIVMDGKRPAGIFTERDLMTRVLLEGRDVDQVQVADVMTSDLVVAKPGDSIRSAVLLMHKHHFRHLPVMGKRGALLGVLSFRDLIGEELKEMRDYLARSEG